MGINYSESGWVSQTFELGDNLRIKLSLDAVTIESGEVTKPSSSIELCPRTRKEANRLSMVLRFASKRLEEIGKGLSND